MQTEMADLIERAREGDAAAARTLMPRIYEQLRQLARRYLAGDPNATISTTTLVHEAYLSMLGDHTPEFRDTAHFFGYAATAMRHILIDAARRRRSQKHGSGMERLDVDLEQLQVGAPDCDLLALDQVLTRLSELSPRLAKVVDLHVFAGLGFADIAQGMGVTERTVQRDWRKARAFLHEQLDVK